MLPTIRLRLTQPNGNAYYLFNRNLQWVVFEENGAQSSLPKICPFDPIMFMFALEEALVVGDGSQSPAMALAAAKTYCADDWTINLINNVRKPHRAKPKADLSLDAAGLDLNVLAAAK